MRASRDAFAERGYDGTTLAQIAGRLGVSPAALLRHAPGKRELFTAAMAPPATTTDPFPLDFLRDADAGADPAPVLRELAHTAIPFLERMMGENIARWLFAKSGVDAAAARHFGEKLRGQSSPPRRVFGVLEDYLRRARDAGRLQVSDTRSAALIFMGTMNAYVFFHRILKVVDPPVPLDDYVETVVEIFTSGAIRPARARRRAASGPRPARRRKA
ncbi:MAG TPA: TetR/AcrR family transcriptional regulator [Vicinamibacteria bacterium]|nr:TetR/AcrR family transcriptional regulator [Vicinamibacteria bacterium]